MSKVYNIIKPTRLDYGFRLSSKLKNNIWYKREDTLPIFSFKLRGAYNKIANLPEDVKKRGVITFSSGNHSQGVGYSINKLNVPATIVMPTTTDKLKVESVKQYGANIILKGNSVEESFEEVKKIQDDKYFVHPFNDIDVIMGQSTIGYEILEQLEDIDNIFCCVGGGGLISGVLLAVKEKNPKVKVIGVESSDAPAMTLSLEKGKIVKLDKIGYYADGSAVKEVGNLTFDICMNNIDDILLVNRENIKESIKDMYLDTRTILEPAGAVSIAGCRKYIKDKKIVGTNNVVITSGANMNYDRIKDYLHESKSISCN